MENVAVVCSSFLKLSQDELLQLLMAVSGVLECKQTDILTSLLLHRWEAEDVGVWCSSRSLCAPHIHSVYDIPSLVS